MNYASYWLKTWGRFMKHHLGRRTSVMAVVSVMSTWLSGTHPHGIHLHGIHLHGIHPHPTPPQLWVQSLNEPLKSWTCWSLGILFNWEYSVVLQPTHTRSIHLGIHPHQDPSPQNSHWESDPISGIKPSRPQWQQSPFIPLLFLWG